MQPYYYLKICGLARSIDAELAVTEGADFLGMVFHPGSKRCCTIEVAQEIKEKFASKPRVLVFAYDDYDYILDIYTQLRDMLTFIQVPADHESFEQLVDTLGISRVIPVVHVEKNFFSTDLEPLAAHSILILDTPGFNQDGSKMAGGTGEIFDWQKVKDIERPFLLAGGLRPENICEAIQTVAPFGFDVSSGIESEPGKKDSEKLQKFCQFARESEVFCP